MPVVLAEKGKFYLLSGVNSIKATQRAGEELVECIVRQGLSDEEREELRLADEYFSSLLPPIKMAESFINFREKYHVTQQELARRTGITAGTVHHYESLRKTLSPSLQGHVDNGDLTFKEARCIADLSDYQRQEELAVPFIDGRLSSVHVEALVSKAKASPEASAKQLLAEFLKDEDDAPAEADEPAKLELTVAHNAASEVPITIPNNGATQRYGDDLDGMQTDAFILAGSLEKLASAEIPEYRRLRLMSTLRILSSRLNIAMDHLNRYKTYSSASTTKTNGARKSRASKVS